MTEIAAAQAVETGAKRCGYSQCGEPLPHREGRGPKYRYCPERTWPGGKTCRDLAAEERASHRAAGLDAPLEALRALAERLHDAVDPVAELLTQVQDALDETTAGAVSRIASAERAAEDAARRADAAVTEADAARAAAGSAMTERDRSRQLAAEAEGRAATARREADEQIRAAFDRVAAVERDRGQAQAIAAAARARAEEESLRRADAERRTAAVQGETRALREQLSQAGVTETQLRGDLAAATDRCDQACAETDRLRRHADELAVRLQTAQRDLDAARTVKESLQSRLAELDKRAAGIDAEIGQLRRALTAETAARSSAEATAASARSVAADAAERIMAAETRVDRILTALADQLTPGSARPRGSGRPQP